MKKIYLHVAGNTMDSHKKIIKKLKRKGAKVVKTPGESDVTILFCPIVSRFETDIKSALSSIEGLGSKKVILVAMHHTFDPKYTLPNYRELDNRVTAFVDCLFFEKKGLLKCHRNKTAIKTVREEMGLPRYSTCIM